MRKFVFLYLILFKITSSHAEINAYNVAEALGGEHGSTLSALIKNERDQKMVRNILLKFIKHPNQYSGIAANFGRSTRQLSNLAMAQVGSFLEIDPSGKWSQRDLQWMRHQFSKSNKSNYDERTYALLNTLALTGSALGFKFLLSFLEEAQEPSMQLSISSMMLVSLKKHSSIDAEKNQARLDVIYHKPYVPYLKQNVKDRSSWHNQTSVAYLQMFQDMISSLEASSLVESDQLEWSKHLKQAQEMQHQLGRKVVDLKTNHSYNDQKYKVSQADVKTDKLVTREIASELQAKEDQPPQDDSIYYLVMYAVFIFSASYVFMRRRKY